MRPETTGDTASGRSMRAVRIVLPRKSKRAIAHAAQRPKPRLAGTAMPATRRVRRMAERAAGSTKLAV
jgi:hypothetical protein